MALDTKTPKDVRPFMGLELIEEEQALQMLKYPSEHDDAHDKGELAAAAAALAKDGVECVDADTELIINLGDDVDWITPLVESRRGDRVQQLAVAGALIASEIDRLLRARARTDGPRS